MNNPTFCTPLQEIQFWECYADWSSISCSLATQNILNHPAIYTQDCLSSLLERLYNFMHWLTLINMNAIFFDITQHYIDVIAEVDPRETFWAAES